MSYDQLLNFTFDRVDRIMKDQDEESSAYDELLVDLRKAYGNYTSSLGSRREGCIQSLAAVIRYLRLDDQIRQERLVTPLIALGIALRDMRDGVASPLFRTPKRGGRRSASALRQGLTVAAAVAVDLLMGLDISSRNAADKVARRLDTLQVTTQTGARINAGTVLNWRKKLRAKAGRGRTAELYHDLCREGPGKLRNLPGNKEAAVLDLLEDTVRRYYEDER